LPTNRRNAGDTENSTRNPTISAIGSQSGGPSPVPRSSRRSGRSSHSAESVVSTVTMSSTPRTTPSVKSPRWNHGTIALVMMTFDSASVSVPSSPYPTSIRTRRSFGATSSSTPLSVSASPSCQVRNSWLA
jgi:hypothetical protein